MDRQEPLYKGEGCPYCNFTGYKGRSGIHEILLVTREIRDLINRGATTDQLMQMAVRQGTVSLRDSCTSLVLSGKTTAEELIKVTYSLD
jgi:type IV pilus assembly protein PilB